MLTVRNAQLRLLEELSRSVAMETWREALPGASDQTIGLCLQLLSAVGVTDEREAIALLPQFARIAAANPDATTIESIRTIVTNPDLSRTERIGQLSAITLPACPPDHDHSQGQRPPEDK
jgi:hypothetical protein